MTTTKGRCLCGETAFEYSGPEEILFHVACLAEPADAVPQFHVHFAGNLPWIEANDSLPRYPSGGAFFLGARGMAGNFPDSP